jgi:hypothetical protein
VVVAGAVVEAEVRVGIEAVAEVGIEVAAEVVELGLEPAL